MSLLLRRYAEVSCRYMLRRYAVTSLRIVSRCGEESCNTNSIQVIVFGCGRGRIDTLQITCEAQS